MHPRIPRHRLVLLLALLLGSSGARCEWMPPTGAFHCPLLPRDSYWYADVRDLPVHPKSAAWIASIGLNGPVHADFGSGTRNGGPIGIPYVAVDASTVPGVTVSFRWPNESDGGPYPLPSDVPIEGGPLSNGARHAIVIDRESCTLYELYRAFPDGLLSWHADSGAKFELDSHEMRPAGHTSADGAGLPILPGLVRPEEVAVGVVGHAIRFTAPKTRRAYLWPARDFASNSLDSDHPPMGAWFRLKSDVDPADFSPMVRPIVEALQVHGMILADNGSPWYLSGVPHWYWDDAVLGELHALTGADFEAVDASSLMVDADSNQIVQEPDPYQEPQ
jgi:hypothetical protein